VFGGDGDAYRGVIVGRGGHVCPGSSGLVAVVEPRALGGVRLQHVKQNVGKVGKGGGWGAGLSQCTLVCKESHHPKDGPTLQFL